MRAQPDIMGELVHHKETTHQVKDEDTGSYVTRVDGDIPVGAGARKNRIPQTLMEAFGNERRWWLTLLVAAHAFDDPKVRPLDILNYLDKLLAVAMHPGMWLPKFLILRDESRAAIIREFSQGGKTLGRVLKAARQTLEADLITFRKTNVDVVNGALAAGTSTETGAAASDVTPTKRKSPEQCSKCPGLRKQIGELQAALKKRKNGPHHQEHDQWSGDARRGALRGGRAGLRGGRGILRGGRNIPPSAEESANRVSIAHLAEQDAGPAAAPNGD